MGAAFGCSHWLAPAESQGNWGNWAGYSKFFNNRDGQKWYDRDNGRGPWSGPVGAERMRQARLERRPEMIEKGHDQKMREKMAGLMKLLWAGLGAMALGMANCAPAFAAQLIDNAATGDQSANIMPIVIGLLVVSVLVIVVFLITGAKRKKKKK